MCSLVMGPYPCSRTRAAHRWQGSPELIITHALSIFGNYIRIWRIPIRGTPKSSQFYGIFHCHLVLGYPHLGKNPYVPWPKDGLLFVVYSSHNGNFDNGNVVKNRICWWMAINPIWANRQILTPWNIYGYGSNSGYGPLMEMVFFKSFSISVFWVNYLG